MQTPFVNEVNRYKAGKPLHPFDSILILMKKALLLIFFLCLPVVAFAQNDATYLNVANPRNPGLIRQGTIEDATFSVRPKGIYTEVGVYLTFSARGTEFQNWEQLEVYFNFTLPEGATVTDSWLWVGEDIIKAILIDRQDATEIYEGIVNAREDPSLLVKHSEGVYELRVFPMSVQEPRRVKITYLVPTLWLTEEAITRLPFDWLATSLNPIEEVDILAWPGNGWEEPALTDAPGERFSEGEDAELGRFHHLTLNRELLESTQSVSFNTPMTDGVYMSTFDTGTGGWYQMAYLPAKTLTRSTSSNVMVLIDNDAAKTTLTTQVLVERARQALKATLTSTDFFNVIVSQLDVDPVSDTWLPAEPDVIDSVFDDIASNSSALYSNLPALLASGLSFVRDQENGGEILLVSSADALSDTDVADQLVADLQTLASPLPPIHIADVANRNVTVTTTDAGFSEGNSYLYNQLALLSGGTYLNVRSGQGYDTMLRDLLGNLGGAIQDPTVFTASASGFTFGQFSSLDGTDAASISRAITEVGNYLGAAPFSVEVSGEYQGESFSDKRVLGAADVFPADQTLKSYWTGLQVQKLERLVPDEDLIAEIREYSYDARVLSLYTAFLALEPGVMGTEVCDTCQDETEVSTSVEEALPSGVQMQVEAFPNPFHDRIIIRIRFPEPTSLHDHTFAIYNVMGQQVKQFDVDAGVVQSLELEWDGTNDAGESVASGMYFFVMTSPSGREVVKVVKI